VCASQGLTLVNFRPRPSPLPPTRLSTEFGGDVPTTTTDLAPFSMDSIAPSIATNAPIVVNAIATTCLGFAVPVPPAASDNCGGSVGVVGTRSDAQPLNAPYPVGVTTITWTATDCSGNMASSAQTVTVNNVNSFTTFVQLNGIFSGTFDRCITFEFFNGSCPNPAFSIDVVMNFVNGFASTSTPINVPCGSYTCVTARDKRHTLRRTANLGVFAGSYTANFTGTRSLRGGNLNDDSYVDILDFGAFVGQFGVNFGTASTTCATPYPHSDISGNATVGLEDFTFIQTAFLQFNDPNCCGNFVMVAPNTPGGPVTDVGVSQLVSGGLWTVARSDLNRDGQLNEQDVAVFTARGISPCIADFDNDGGVAVQDLFTYINSWFAGHPAADMDRSDSLDTTDLFSFLNIWFRGC
ncbi:MAG: HYR domain-containing protein, partial [Phycisphaerales bacterium]|nr:HYR domain-containing protein [Phycisphaerales bacterium]